MKNIQPGALYSDSQRLLLNGTNDVCAITYTGKNLERISYSFYTYNYYESDNTPVYLWYVDVDGDWQTPQGVNYEITEAEYLEWKELIQSFETENSKNSARFPLSDWKNQNSIGASFYHASYPEPNSLRTLTKAEQQEFINLLSDLELQKKDSNGSEQAVWVGGPDWELDFFFKNEQFTIYYGGAPDKLTIYQSNGESGYYPVTDEQLAAFSALFEKWNQAKS